MYDRKLRNELALIWILFCQTRIVAQTAGFVAHIQKSLRDSCAMWTISSSHSELGRVVLFISYSFAMTCTVYSVESGIPKILERTGAYSGCLHQAVFGVTPGGMCDSYSAKACSRLNPADRSAIRSSTSSRPAWMRSVCP
jgi:hypothetical protein